MDSPALNKMIAKFEEIKASNGAMHLAILKTALGLDDVTDFYEGDETVVISRALRVLHMGFADVICSSGIDWPTLEAHIEEMKALRAEYEQEERKREKTPPTNAA